MEKKKKKKKKKEYAKTNQIISQADITIHTCVKLMIFEYVIEIFPTAIIDIFFCDCSTRVSSELSKLGCVNELLVLSTKLWLINNNKKKKT